MIHRAGRGSILIHIRDFPGVYLRFGMMVMEITNANITRLQRLTFRRGRQSEAFSFHVQESAQDPGKRAPDFRNLGVSKNWKAKTMKATDSGISYIKSSRSQAKQLFMEFRVSTLIVPKSFVLMGKRAETRNCEKLILTNPFLYQCGNRFDGTGSQERKTSTKDSEMKR
jgi:hypothetical protein